MLCVRDVCPILIGDAWEIGLNVSLAKLSEVGKCDTKIVTRCPYMTSDHIINMRLCRYIKPVQNNLKTPKVIIINI